MANVAPVIVKPWLLAQERNYWNSNFNGGLPVIRKRDPIHEGTFLVHDLHHFLFRDPIIDGVGVLHERLYLAMRMISEAVTLILADISAVDSARLDARGYDTKRRLAYPVFSSLNFPLGRHLEAELVYANVAFALTGSVERWLNLGVSESALEAYVDKYKVFFAGDMIWNVHNTAALTNPRSQKYALWLRDIVPDMPTTTRLARRYTRGGQIIVADMVRDLFLGRVYIARSGLKATPSPLDGVRARALRFVAGQAKLFFDYPTPSSEEEIDSVKATVNSILHSKDPGEIVDLHSEAQETTDRYISLLLGHHAILSHEARLFKTHYPHYPPAFVNYDCDAVSIPNLAEVAMEKFGKSCVQL